MSIIDERGLFWWNSEAIPDTHFAPDNSVSGLLKVDDDGRIRLDLDGSMPTGHGRFGILFRQQESERDIPGLLRDSNEYVLLLGAIQNGGTMRTNGISFEQYFALDCLKAEKRFRSKAGDTRRYASTSVELRGYEQWLQLESISVDRQKSSLSAQYGIPANQEYPTPDGLLSMEYDMVGPSWGPSKRHKLELKELAYIRFAPTHGAKFEECLEHYQLLQDFLILLTDSDYNLTWPRLTTSEGESKHTVYFLKNTSSAPAPELHQCLIRFREIRDIFGQLFSEWKRRREKFGPGFYLYLGTRRGMKMYTEHRFMNLIWGLEAFDRQKHGEPGPSDALRAKIDRITMEVSRPKDKSWLRRQLARCSEPVLEQRLRRNFATLPLPLDAVALAKFCRECASLRNDFSHFGDARQPMTLRDLDKKSDALSALYHVLLLQEIGVPSSLLTLQQSANWSASVKQRHLRDAGLWRDAGNK